MSGLPVTTAANLVEATQVCGAFVTFSSALNHVKLSKICNDLQAARLGTASGLR